MPSSPPFCPHKPACGVSPPRALGCPDGMRPNARIRDTASSIPECPYSGGSASHFPKLNVRGTFHCRTNRKPRLLLVRNGAGITMSQPFPKSLAASPWKWPAVRPALCFPPFRENWDSRTAYPLPGIQGCSRGGRGQDREEATCFTPRTTEGALVALSGSRAEHSRFRKLRVNFYPGSRRGRVETELPENLPDLGLGWKAPWRRRVGRAWRSPPCR